MVSGITPTELLRSQLPAQIPIQSSGFKKKKKLNDQQQTTS